MRDELLEVADAAKVLGLGSQRVRQLADTGQLVALRTSRGTRVFRLVDVEAFAAVRRAEARTAKRGRR